MTGPENPTLVTLRGTGMRLGGRNYSSVFRINGISGGPPLGSQNTGVPAGQMKMCVLFPGCANYLPIPFGNAKATQGVGVGGMITVNTFQVGQGFKLSVQGAPWTMGIASISGITTETPNGGVTTYTKTLQGFVHGPASGTSSTAAISGVLQIIAPNFIETSLGVPDTFQAVWADIRLHFIPEPGLLLLLGSGVAGLLMLGRSRMRS
jgi:hypothetical protein